MQPDLMDILAINYQLRLQIRGYSFLPVRIISFFIAD
jgi:hypothetical protein